jgi:hypothetical protein
MSPTQRSLPDNTQHSQETYKKLKVKVTLVQALRLFAGLTANRGSRGIAVPLLDHSTRRG